MNKTIINEAMKESTKTFSEKAVFELKMLGTNGAFVFDSYGKENKLEEVPMHNNALIQVGDKKLLIDVGLTAPIALAIHGIRLEEIEAIFITHQDPDHLHGLAYLIQRFYWIFTKSGHVPHRTKIFAAKKIKKAILNHLSDLEFQGMTVNDLVEIVDVENETFEFNGFTFNTIDTSGLHCAGMPSYGLKIVSPSGENIVYSSDIENLEESRLVEYVDEKTAYIFQDTQFFKGGVHANFDDILNYYPKDTHEKIHIMHYAVDLTPHLDKIQKAGVKIAKAGAWLIV